jgi:hypothetical protein
VERLVAQQLNEIESEVFEEEQQEKNKSALVLAISPSKGLFLNSN